MKLLDTASKTINIISEKQALKTAGKMPEFISEQNDYILEGTGFQCGFAGTQIMPDDIDTSSYWVAGFKTGNKVGGVIDPLTVNVMWLDCGKNEGIVFISADLIGLTGYDVSQIRGQLGDFRVGTGCKEIIISCTHTHAGIDTVGYWGRLPSTGKNKEFMLQLTATIKLLCYYAYNSRKKGRLYSGFINVPELVVDGREPCFFDDRLTRLRFVPDDGGNETWYLNYCAHPNTLGKNNNLVSADYPCYIRKRIKESINADILFSVGATASISIKNIVSDPLENTIKAGVLLGEKALEINNDKELEPKLLFSQKFYSAPVDNTVLYLMKLFNVVNAKVVKSKSSLGVGLLCEIDYIRAGDFSVLTVPGEIFPELVYPGHFLNEENSSTGDPSSVNPKTLSEIAGDKNIVIFGVTNDMTGYIVPPNDFILNISQPYLSTVRDRFGHNHYNETNSLGPNAAYALAKAFRQQIEKLKNKNLI
ncbi:MAG: hypothetical protein IJK60_02615 [Clostridia bacterium]|nr:hypothetical protein [Clostridia bacterium]